MGPYGRVQRSLALIAITDGSGPSKGVMYYMLRRNRSVEIIRSSKGKDS